MVKLLSAASRISERESSQSELNHLLADVRRQYHARAPGTSISAIAGAPFVAPPSGASCSGLSVLQVDPSGTTREVRYFTECVAGAKIAAGAPLAHPELMCAPGEVPRVTALYLPSGRRREFPATGSALGIAACFRVDTAGVSVETGAVFRAGRNASTVNVPLFLTASDRSPAVQIFPN